MSQKVTYRIVTVLAIFAILLAGCSGGNTNKLIGKWEYKEPTSGVTAQIEFTKDKITITAAGNTLLETPYTYVDSKTIKVTDPTTKEVVESSYSINGDKLTFSFMGQSLDLTKVK